MNTHDELINIILQNTVTVKSRTAFLKITEEITLLLRVCRDHTISITTSYNADNFVDLSFTKFGTDSTVEEFSLGYNLIPFRVLVDKKHTSRNAVAILLVETDDEDEKFCEIFSKSIGVVEDLAKHLIQITLETLDEFMKKHSDKLTIKDFGYINF